MFEHAIFQNVVAHYDDVTYRLVLADWFEGNGDTCRANYIRLSVKAHDPSLLEKVRIEANQQATELYLGNVRRWNIPTHQFLMSQGISVKARRGVVRRLHYRHGLIEGIDVSPCALLDKWDSISRIGPIRKIRIYVTDRWNELAHWQRPDSVNHLCVSNLNYRQFESLMSWPWLDGLSALEFRGGQLGQVSRARLIHAAFADRLQWLHFVGISFPSYLARTLNDHFQGRLVFSPPQDGLESEENVKAISNYRSWYGNWHP